LTILQIQADTEKFNVLSFYHNDFAEENTTVLRIHDIPGILENAQQWGRVSYCEAFLEILLVYINVKGHILSAHTSGLLGRINLYS